MSQSQKTYVLPENKAGNIEVTVSRGETYRRDFGLIVVGAIIFVLSFMWKDFLIEIEHIFFPKSSGIFCRFIYIVIVSIILLFIILMLRNFFEINSPEGSIIVHDQYIDKTGHPRPIHELK